MEDLFDYDELLYSYFSGTLSEKEKSALEEWRDASEENYEAFKNAEKVWQSLDLLQEMKKYDVSRALSDFHKKTKQLQEDNHRGLFFYWQRIAAILLLPILIAGAFYVYQRNYSQKAGEWQTLTTLPGVKSHIKLPDGTLVWINSGTTLSFPLSFSDSTRNVKLVGEAFFDVAKDKKHPFVVDLGKINIRVVGTQFNAINYEQEDRAEIVLASGKVKLMENDQEKNQLITEMSPGDQAIYSKTNNSILLKKVDSKKYSSWIEGKLVFRDDPIYEVVSKLNRWFNVEIEIADSSIRDYTYTATFESETIEQILSLIKRTSPVEFTIIPGKRLDDGSFEKQRIILRKK